MNIKSTRDFLKDLNISPRKSLGQNFLINQSLTEKIVREVRKFQGFWVETGPGPGALTRIFSQEEKSRLILIEKDRKIAEYWKARGFSVKEQDALKVSLQTLPSPVLLFGNLPYHLAGPLILKASLCSDKISGMIFMLQKEVGLRVLSGRRTKDYGLLSVMAQTFWQVQRSATARKRDFYPAPQVEGCVLKFQARKQAPVSADKFLKFLKVCFSQRRKKLLRRLPVPLREAETALSEINKSLDTRAEELSPEEFVLLFQKISRLQPIRP